MATSRDSAAGTRVPMLEVRDLCVDFEVDGVWTAAAIDLDYAVGRSEVLAIVGESGSGKSSSSMALVRLLPGNSRVTGQVKLNGEEILGMSAKGMRKIRGKRIAVIFQEPMTALDPLVAIGAQLIEAIREHNPISHSAARRKALALLGMVELPDPEKAFNSYPHQLSGGQCQRVVIAQAISCDPDLLIADEPTTALDVTVQAEILDLLRNLHHRLDSAIILITHDMGVVADLADHIVVMRRGEIVERGSAAQVFNSPQHEYTRQLLAAVPHLGYAKDRQDQATAPGEQPVLVMDDVTIDYPKRGRVAAFRAVDRVSLQILPGELVGLVGESGSGKTTVGRAVMGLIPITSGTMQVLGSNMWASSRKDLRRLRRQAGIVFQDPSSSLNPRMRIGRSIGEPMLVTGAARGAELKRRVQDLLEQVELPRAFYDRFPNELSGGQKQRVVIARALSLNPRLLIADEPTSALDVSVQARFLELLLELQEQSRFACLFISHDLAVVDMLAHRIAVMQHGMLVEEGPRDDVLKHSTDPYTRRLIAAVPLPDPEAQRRNREQRWATVHDSAGAA